MKNTAIFGLGITVITLVLNRKLQSPSNARHLAGVVMGVVVMYKLAVPAQRLAFSGRWNGRCMAMS